MESVSEMRLLPPEIWIERQTGTLKAVGEKNYKIGIASPRFDTIKQGIAAEARYNDEMMKVLEEERRMHGLEASSLDEWYTYSLKLGAPRLVPGVIVRVAEVEKFVGKWQPMLLSHVRDVDRLSDVTFQDRKAKMTANVDGLVELKGKWKGRSL